MDLGDGDLREALQGASKRARGPSRKGKGRFKRLRRGEPSGRAEEPVAPIAVAAPPSEAGPAGPEVVGFPGRDRASGASLRASEGSPSSRSGRHLAISSSAHPEVGARAGREGGSGGRDGSSRSADPILEGFNEACREAWEASWPATMEALVREGTMAVARTAGCVKVAYQRMLREGERLAAAEEGRERAVSEVRRLQAKLGTVVAEKEHLAVQLATAEDRVGRAEIAARNAWEERKTALAKLKGAQESRDSAISQVRALMNEKVALFGSLSEAKALTDDANARARDALARVAVAEAETKQARLGVARAVKDFQESAEFRKVVASCSVPMALRGFRIAKRGIAALYPDLDLRSIRLTAGLMDSVGGDESSDEEGGGDSDPSGSSGDEAGASAGPSRSIAAPSPTRTLPGSPGVDSAPGDAGAAVDAAIATEAVPGEDTVPADAIPGEDPVPVEAVEGVFSASDSPVRAAHPLSPRSDAASTGGPVEAPFGQVVVLDVEDAEAAPSAAPSPTGAPAVHGREGEFDILVD